MTEERKRDARLNIAGMTEWSKWIHAEKNLA
jgi:hypothetical protein